ncbi:glycosyltransferase [Psychrobacter celer]|uniref:glycosyltransferase n=1 Tax=Psychrobacter celer TaxID=306572 RepID=UPI003FD4D1DE
MFTVNIDFNEDAIFAEIKSDAEGKENDSLEYAFYLYKDGIRIETKWYSKQPSCIFNIKRDSGFYYVKSFIRESKSTKPIIVESETKLYKNLSPSDYEKQVFILMRYSILSRKAARSWKIGQRDINDYRQMLFSDERLDLHENIFFDLTLHSVDEAIKNSNSNVKLIMFISNELPDIRKKKLYNAAKEREYLNIKELTLNDDTLVSMGDEVVNLVSKHHGEVVYATVRLDDDDALHPHFLQRLDEYIEPAYVGKCVSFSNGYAGLFDGSKFTAFHTMNAINNAQGLTAISMKMTNGEIKGLKSIYNSGVSHSRTHWKVPVVADGAKPMYIRTVHAQGDFYSEEYEKRLSTAETKENEEVLKDFLLNPKIVD